MFWKKGGTVLWLFCGIRVEQSLVFCVTIRRPLFISFCPFFLLPFLITLFICLLWACILVCQEFRFRFVRNNVFWSWNVICVISNVELVIKNSVLEKGIEYARKKKNRVWNCILCNDNGIYDIINNQNIVLLWLMHNIYEMNEKCYFSQLSFHDL